MFGRNRQPYPSMTPQEMVQFAADRGINTPQSIVGTLSQPQIVMQEQPRGGALNGLRTFFQNPNQALFGQAAPEGSYPMDSAPLAELRQSLISNPQSLGYSPQSLARIKELGGQKVSEGMLQGLNYGIPEIAQNIEQYNKGEGLKNPITMPTTSEQIELAKRSSLNSFDTSATVAPRVGGLLNDIASGYKENRNNPFQIENLDTNPNKNFATRVGEGLGSVARFGQSPMGRAALVGGAVLGSGGSGLEALAYGGTAGLANQQAVTKDKFYREQLENQGFDTSQMGGYIGDDLFKNYSLTNYRQGMLGIGNKRLTQSDYKLATTELGKMLANNTISPEEYISNMQAVNTQFENSEIKGLVKPKNVGVSNQTYNSRINMPTALGIQGSNAAVNAGRLNLAATEAQYDIPYKQAQTAKIQGEIYKPYAEKQQKIGESLTNIGYAEKLIKENPNLVGVYSTATAGVGRYTGGTLGMSKADLAKRGEIARTVGSIKNDLIQQAKANGQSGINTMAEINQATAGLDENSSSQELLGALSAMKRVANRIKTQAPTNINPYIQQSQVRQPARRTNQRPSGGKDF